MVVVSDTSREEYFGRTLIEISVAESIAVGFLCLCGRHHEMIRLTFCLVSAQEVLAGFLALLPELFVITTIPHHAVLSG